MNFFSIFLLIMGLFACQENQNKNPTVVLSDAAQSDCIKAVLALDDSLGRVRNHACEMISLAETIQNYTDGMAKVEMNNCPPNFSDAFEKHRQAWIELIPFVEQYPNLRGEMHDLFDGFSEGEKAAEFEPLLKAVWDTWAFVEQAKIIK